jgi:hypothetical protein
VYWRLRFRFLDRSRTVYLGADETLLATVRRELAVLQTPDRSKRKLAQTVQDAKLVMRRIKARSRPLLAEQGFSFHGKTLRRARRPPVNSTR